MAAKLGAALRVPISMANGDLAVACSMGVAYDVGEDATTDEVLARADSAPCLVKAQPGATRVDTSTPERFRNAATNVQEIVVPNAGHWLMEEAPAATITAVQDFLAAH